VCVTEGVAVSDAHQVTDEAPCVSEAFGDDLEWFDQPPHLGWIFASSSSNRTISSARSSRMPGSTWLGSMRSKRGSAACRSSGFVSTDAKWLVPRGKGVRKSWGQRFSRWVGCADKIAEARALRLARPGAHTFSGTGMILSQVTRESAVKLLILRAKLSRGRVAD